MKDRVGVTGLEDSYAVDREGNVWSYKWERWVDYRSREPGQGKIIRRDCVMI